MSDVIVRVQRRTPGTGWKNAGLGTTNANGRYRVELLDKVGRYRATVAEQTIGSKDVCHAAKSRPERHAH